MAISISLDISQLELDTDKLYKDTKEFTTRLARNTLAGMIVSFNPNPLPLIVGNAAAMLTRKMTNAVLPEFITKRTNGKELTKPEIFMNAGIIGGVLAGTFGSYWVGREVSALFGLKTSATALFFGTLFSELQKAYCNTEVSSLEKNEAIVNLTSENFAQEVENSKTPVVIDAYGTWCPPCKMMAPIFEDVAQELGGKVKFAKLNIENDNELASKLEIRVVPTLLFYQNGKKAGELVGLTQKEVLQAKIEEHFAQANAGA